MFQAQCLLHVGCRVASILCSKLCYQLWYLFVVNLVEVNLTASKCSPNWKTIPTVKFCEREDLTECQWFDVFLQKVIGWFKFRRNTQSLVSMRERFIHHNLIEKLNFTPAKGIYRQPTTKSKSSFVQLQLMVQILHVILFSSTVFPCKKKFLILFIISRDPVWDRCDVMKILLQGCLTCTRWEASLLSQNHPSYPTTSFNTEIHDCVFFLLIKNLSWQSSQHPWAETCQHTNLTTAFVVLQLEMGKL